MNWKILGSDDPEWNDSLAGLPHDFYQTPAYYRFESENGEGIAHAFVARSGEKRFLWPYLLKQVVVPGVTEHVAMTEVRSAYGYSGPVCSLDCDTSFLTLAFQSLVEVWRSQGVVNAFCRLHPVLSTHDVCARVIETGALDAWKPANTGFLVHHGKTVSIDLRLDTDTRRARYSAALRKGVRRNQRDGVRTVRDADFRHLRDFYEFYIATMDRNQASKYYYFSFDYFERLARHLPGIVHLFVTGAGKRPSCAALISEYEQKLQALFIMANPNSEVKAPSRTLIDDVCDWGRERQATDFHLGGGVGGAKDSLFDFKAQFSGVHRDFYTCRLVLDSDKYARLVRIRGAVSQLDEAETFFPAWRKPLPLAAELEVCETVQS
ncbi:MAG: GNAT family N-acetyltransferase [Bryobacteraceae bacterium]